MQRRSFQAALAKFDEALKLKPKSAYAFSLRARALKNLNRADEALADVKKAMALDPKSVQPYLTLAGMSLRDKEVAKARQYLAQADKIEPHNYEVVGLIGTCYAIEQKYKEALPYVNESLKLRPDAHRYAQRAAIYRLLGDQKSELKDYDKATALAPDNAIYATERATTYLQTNRLKDALNEVNRALSLDPKYGQAYYIRANIEWHQKQTTATLADLGKALTLEQNGTFFHFRGSIYEIKDEWRRALNDQLAADRLLPNQGYIKAAVARNYHHLLEPQSAMEAINAAIKLDPKNSEYYEERSAIYRTMMDYDLSVADDTRAIECAKKPPINSLINRIRYNRAHKKFDLALKDQNRIISYFSPSKWELKQSRAQIYEEMGDYQKAKVDLDLVITKQPSDTNFFSRARVNWKLKRLKEALDDCNQAIVIAPGMSSYYLLRGEIHMAMGKTQEAQKDKAAARAADEASLPPR